MTGLKYSTEKSHPSNTESEDSSSVEIFERVIEAAKQNGMTLEDWLQDAIKSSARPQAPSQHEQALAKLLKIQRQSRMNALEMQNAEPVAIAIENAGTVSSEAEELIQAITNLGNQLKASQETTSATADEDTQQITPEVQNSEEDSEAPTVEKLRARISALKSRLSEAAETQDTKPAVPAEPDEPKAALHFAEQNVEVQQEEEAHHSSAEPIIANQLSAEKPQNTTIELENRIEEHFSSLSDRISNLLESKQAADHETPILADKMDKSIARLEEKLSALPSRVDFSTLQKDVIKNKNSHHVSELEEKINTLEHAVKQIKPGVSRDMASLLDLAIQKLEKSANTVKQPDQAQESILKHISEIEHSLENLPMNVAKQQPSPESIIAFLPPRETLESIEHTVGRLEALMLEQKDQLSSLTSSDLNHAFKDRFDGLLSRLDDTVKRMDAAELVAAKRSQENVQHQKAENENFLGKLVEQIETLGTRAAENAQTDEAARLSVAATRDLQDDLARIEGQLAFVLDRLDEQPEKGAPQKSDSSETVSETVLETLNEALDRLERGLDAKSRQTIDDVAALVKSSRETSGHDDILKRQLGNVPDTLTILLNKVYDLESGLNRLQDQQTERPDATNQHRAGHVAGEVIPPPQRNSQSSAAKLRDDPKNDPGMDYISAARRATKMERADATSKLGAENGKSKLNKLKLRAKEMLAQQEAELESNPTGEKRRKIIGICLGITLVIAAVGVALYSQKELISGKSPLLTGNINTSTSSNGKFLSETMATQNQVELARKVLNQKIPDRLPSMVQLQGSEIAGAAPAPKPIKVAIPVSRPETPTADNSFKYVFVAPAPPKNIGPLALRYRAATGDPAAQFEIASRYADGFGTKPDLTKAVEWYRRAANQGLAAAQYRLGSLLEHGRGTPKDIGTAAVLYEKAAIKGNSKAMYNLGVLHAQGALGKPDFQQAARWFTEAAEVGIRDGQFNLAILYARGLGVSTDLEEAYLWFSIAAEAGDADAVDKSETLREELGVKQLAELDQKIKSWKPRTLVKRANIVPIPDEGWLALSVPDNAENKLEKYAGKQNGIEPEFVKAIDAMFEQSDTISSALSKSDAEPRI